MPKCLILCLYRDADGAYLRTMELPPMTLPQSLLPDGARFAGVGVYGQDDAYLYVLKGTPEAQETIEASLLDHLITLAKKDAPQDFVLAQQEGVWTLETRELEQDVF